MKFLVAAMLLFLAGCSAKADDREVVRFWGMGREGEVVAELIPEFEKQNPGIRIDLQQIPWSAAHEKLLTAFAGRVTPDIAQLGSSWVAELVALKALEPIDGWLAQSQSVNAEDFFPGTWKGNVIGGRTWGVPWYADTRLLFYRKDLLQRAGFSQVPQDWSGWTAAMQAIEKRAPKDSYAIFLPTNEYDPLIALALQQPEPLLRNGGRYGNFRSDSFKKVTDFYLGLYQQGLAPRASNTEISNVYDEFARGRFAFYITGPWNIGEFKSRLPADLQDDWMTAPLPGPNGPGASTAGGSSLAMFRRSEHKGAAWKFIEYLSRPDVQLRFFELTGDLPPRRSVWDQPLLANDPYATAFRQQLERTVAAPAVPEWERIATQIQLGTERAVAGQISGEQLRAQLDARADSILEKRRWKLAREARQ
jgi:multiple sugar transport system substrate-binding protein